MILSPTYRAEWLREDLLRAIGTLADVRVRLAGMNTFEARMADGALRSVAEEIARVVVSPHSAELADLLAELRAKQVAA